MNLWDRVVSSELYVMFRRAWKCWSLMIYNIMSSCDVWSQRVNRTANILVVCVRSWWLSTKASSVGSYHAERLGSGWQQIWWSSNPIPNPPDHHRTKSERCPTCRFFPLNTGHNPPSWPSMGFNLLITGRTLLSQLITRVTGMSYHGIFLNGENWGWLN